MRVLSGGANLIVEIATRTVYTTSSIGCNRCTEVIDVVVSDISPHITGKWDIDHSIFDVGCRRV
ncbi:MAG: hypothetical protein CM15mP1_1270 [Methanobacteriota archaeon]|nr:MAG: hypothetical protein CM15mP1_1270 [Euryarchaeota archaeon]